MGRGLWNYMRYLWEGRNNKPDIKKILAVIFSYNFISNFSYAVKKWSEGRNLEGLSASLMIEAGLIAALIGATSYFNWKEGRDGGYRDGNYYQGGNYSDGGYTSGRMDSAPDGQAQLPTQINELK